MLKNENLSLISRIRVKKLGTVIFPFHPIAGEAETGFTSQAIYLNLKLHVQRDSVSKHKVENSSRRYLISTSSLCTYIKHTDARSFTHIHRAHRNTHKQWRQTPYCNKSNTWYVAVFINGIGHIATLFLHPTLQVARPQSMSGLQHLPSSSQVHVYLSQVKQLSQQHPYFQKKLRK